MTTSTQTKSATNAKKLLGKVALVTGGSRGIGRGIALVLAQQGAVVAVTYAKNAEAAQKTVKDVEALGSKAYAIKADVKSDVDSKKLSEELKKLVGKIDILVNNAGVYEGAPLPEITLEQYDNVFGVNVRGVVATTIAALPLINDGGRIINISSGVATMTMPGYSLYSATKAALNALTPVWAQDLGQRKITVNGVSPGTTESDMLHQALTPDVKEYLVGKTALGRLGQPEDIANVVAFLASDEGGWVTGQTIETNGGLTI